MGPNHYLCVCAAAGVVTGGDAMRLLHCGNAALTNMSLNPRPHPPLVVGSSTQLHLSGKHHESPNKTGNMKIPLSPQL